MDKLELLVSRHKKIIRKEKYKKSGQKIGHNFCAGMLLRGK